MQSGQFENLPAQKNKLLEGLSLVWSCLMVMGMFLRRPPDPLPPPYLLLYFYILDRTLLGFSNQKCNLVHIAENGDVKFSVYS